MTIMLNYNGMPGKGTARNTSPRRVFKSSEGGMYLPAGKQIAGACSRDPGNTGTLDVLRPGMPMGKIASVVNSLGTIGQYAPSIIGVTSEALDGAETALDMPAAVVTEILRRCGATGTFKLTGPPTAGGTVRTSTVTYSGAADSDTMTITALGTAAVWTLTPLTGTDGGTFKLRVILPSGSYEDTADITFNATGATFGAAIDAALEALTILPDTAVTVSSVDTTGVSTITWLSSLGDVRMQLIQDNLTDGGVFEGNSALVHTTVGVNGEFISGSFIQPTDGSETILTFVDDVANGGTGIKTTDASGTSIVVPFDKMPYGGLVESAQLLHWPSDTSLRAWYVAALQAVGPFSFDHVF